MMNILQHRLSRFQVRDTKLDTFLVKNMQTQAKMRKDKAPMLGPTASSKKEFHRVQYFLNLVNYF